MPVCLQQNLGEQVLDVSYAPFTDIGDKKRQVDRHKAQERTSHHVGLIRQRQSDQGTADRRVSG